MKKGCFTIHSPWEPAGDQPKAIAELVHGLRKGTRHQTLLGVTGSGKTFTMANVIENWGKPTLVIAHNKTLAAQLAQEYREFFPESAVHYFVSYYDFYQPEAYIPHSDTYIEKDAQVNEEIDRLRHATTQALLTRRDVIVVASVSCIYGLGSPEEYEVANILISRREKLTRATLMRRLITLHFERTNADLKPGVFRGIGNAVEIVGSGDRHITRIEWKGEKIDRIELIDLITRRILRGLDSVVIFPAKHFMTPGDEMKRALAAISDELQERLSELTKAGKLLEADRLKRRTNYDMAMMREVGYCNGIENYSRHISGKKAGEPPETLLSYFPRAKDGTPEFLTVIDESHVTLPQIRGMYEGDQSRKRTLAEHGFRLPSALDNRPLRFSEFDARIGAAIYTSATPAEYELELSRKEGKVVEQIIRPTGLVDPEIEVRPIISSSKGKSYGGQIADLIEEVIKVTGEGGRSIVTTLTKKMAEDLSEYLKEKKIKAEYLHSDIKTLERIKILTEFRRGTFDCLIGVNLLREGLDLPEVVFIGILDADKEGFLRSETSLIQTIGRASRNVRGRVILYADHMTGSMERAIGETNRRRGVQLAYNKKHGITPKSIQKSVGDITEQIESTYKKTVADILAIDKLRFSENPKKLIAEKEKQMNEAVKELDFETAAIVRDELLELRRLVGKTLD